MIDLGTIAGLHEREHELHCYCHRCDRWSVLDLASMVRAGRGARRLPLRVRCRVCGEIGTIPVRPPMPAQFDGMDRPSDVLLTNKRLSRA